MSIEENKAVFRRYVEEVWIKGNLDVADEIFAEKYLSHPPNAPAEERTPEDVKKFVGDWHAAFSDTENVIEDMIGEGDEVLNRWRLEATHSGEFRGIPATGKRINVTGMGLFRFSDGKVVESWDNFDQLGMLQQLGAIPGS
jgi:steroid delta-isomerase-like uncharacterized protein